MTADRQALRVVPQRRKSVAEEMALLSWLGEPDDERDDPAAHLTIEQIEELGRELDALRQALRALLLPP